MGSWKKLILLFVIISFIKSILALLTTAPNAFSDDYVYLKMAWSIFNNHNFMVYNTFSAIYPPLYSILLSSTYFFSNMNVIYAVMKIINAFVSTLTIFPVYFIAKDFLKEKDCTIAVFITALITTHFLYPSYILAENLLFPLTAFTIYFLYLAFKSNNNKWFMVSGLFLGMAFLTKIVAFALVPVALIAYLFLRKEVKLAGIISHYILAGVTVVPYILWRIFSSAQKSFNYADTVSTQKLFDNITSNGITFINWNINYAGYLILAGGVIFAIYFIAGLFLKKEKNLKIIYMITSLSSLFFIFLAANHSSTNFLLHNSPFMFYSYRPLGRYIAAIFPFVMLVGFIVYKKNLTDYKKLMLSTIITSAILVISSQLTLSALFPINNSDLSFIGVLKYLLEYLIYSKTSFEVIFYCGSFLLTAIILATLPFVMLKIRKSKALIPLIFIFLIINFSLAYTVHTWNINTYWTNNNQMLMGQWINKNIAKDKVVMIDIRDCTLRDKEGLNDNLCYGDTAHGSIIGFFINNPIVIEDPSKKDNSDYLVTQSNRENTKLVKEFGKFKLYMLGQNEQ